MIVSFSRVYSRHRNKHLHNTNRLLCLKLILYLSATLRLSIALKKFCSLRMKNTTVFETGILGHLLVKDDIFGNFTCGILLAHVHGFTHKYMSAIMYTFNYKYLDLQNNRNYYKPLEISVLITLGLTVKV